MEAHDSGTDMEAHGGGTSMEARRRGGMEALTAASRPSRAPPPPFPMEGHGDSSTTMSRQRRSGRVNSDERVGSDGSTTTMLIVVKRGGIGVQAALESSTRGGVVEW
jgi:hypothetical protein